MPSFRFWNLFAGIAISKLKRSECGVPRAQKFAMSKQRLHNFVMPSSALCNDVIIDYFNFRFFCSVRLLVFSLKFPSSIDRVHVYCKPRTSNCPIQHSASQCKCIAMQINGKRFDLSPIVKVVFKLFSIHSCDFFSLRKLLSCYIWF